MQLRSFYPLSTLDVARVRRKYQGLPACTTLMFTFRSQGAWAPRSLGTRLTLAPLVKIGSLVTTSFSSSSNLPHQTYVHVKLRPNVYHNGVDGFTLFCHMGSHKMKGTDSQIYHVARQLSDITYVILAISLS